MIDLATEDVFRLAAGPKRVPPQRAGRPVHPSTFFRWAKNGVRADDGTVVRLETIRVGRTLCTSAQALQRFCEKLSGTPSASVADGAETERRLADGRADQELRRRGF